jgi:hypothetical protein
MSSQDSTEYKDNEDQEIRGTCCFCMSDCNPLSQACGHCMRRGINLSLNTIPAHEPQDQDDSKDKDNEQKD